MTGVQLNHIFKKALDLELTPNARLNFKEVNMTILEVSKKIDVPQDTLRKNL